MAPKPVAGGRAQADSFEIPVLLRTIMILVVAITITIIIIICFGNY
jgi:hypothetical protein